MIKSAKKKTPITAATEQGSKKQEKRFVSKHDSTVSGVAAILTFAEAALAKTMLEAALIYARAGIPVFPCTLNKKPIFNGGFKVATTDPKKIERWWRKFPRAMIGVPTGEASGLAVLDLDYEVDPVSGGVIKNGRAELEAMFPAESYTIPETTEVRTPRGGSHLYFKYENGFKSSAGKFARHIDTRADGGYVIVPPSKRRDGGAYEVVGSTAPEQFAVAPEWIAGIFRGHATGSKTKEASGNSSKTASIDELRAALSIIPNNSPSWDDWNRMGMAIHAATEGSDDGFGAFDEWSKKWDGYDEQATADRWEAFHKSPPTRIGAGTIFHLANEADPNWRKAAGLGGTGTSISVEDFYAYMPSHTYLYVPTMELWPKESVNGRLGKLPEIDELGRPVRDEDGKITYIKANLWLDKYRSVEQMTWAPGRPLLIPNYVMSDGGWIEKEGVTCLNLYRAPVLSGGDANQAHRWLEHVRRVYPNDADHIIAWAAHRVQKPHEKINHALVLGGKQGIGKDSLLEPIKRAVGPWNFVEVSPKQLIGRFNGFTKSVILRVNEGRDLGEVSRFEFYESSKVYLASPPDVLRVDEKNLREHAVLNCTGVVITTNHRINGIYLPPDDRRHYVAWSECDKQDFDKDYWTGLWDWYEEGGFVHVAAYLASLDISAFNPKAPPPKTPTFHAIVHANLAPEDAELADVLDALGQPNATSLPEIITQAGFIKGEKGGLHEWLSDRKNRRTIPHRLEQCGYVQAPNPNTKDGLWVVEGQRRVIYVRADLGSEDQLKAARKLAGG